MTDFINSIFDGTAGAWSGGIAHSIIILSFVIALGKILGKIKIAGVSFGVTWILFVGIVFSHFGMSLDPNLLHFLKEFGLILFVYSIGLQVGPGFFSSLKSGGIGLNALALLVVLGGVGVTIALHFITKIPMTTMAGIMSGAVTNTPGLGAAQQAYADSMGTNAPDIALGYAVAYPLGVIGCILSFILMKAMFYKNNIPVAVKTAPNKGKIEVSKALASNNNAEGVAIGTEGIRPSNRKYISRRIIISKRKLNGMVLGKLEFENVLGASVTRIRRAGIELKATPEIRLQYGDQVTVVGSEQSIAAVEKVLGNSRKRLDEPNLVPIFMGIAVGCILGSIPIHFPGIPQPVKLGLAGGPLIVSLLVSHFGPQFKVITYTTASANLMLREIGISIFLACVGLEAGNGFVDTIVNHGGYVWIGYGALITVIPLLLAGIVGRFAMKLDYNTLIGVLAGSSTNPPALAFAGEQDKNSDAAAVGYATVYPLTMFFRVLLAQMLILFFL